MAPEHAVPRRKRNRLGWTSTALLLPASVHPALADATAPTSNGRPLERVADDSKHPRRPDRSSSTRDRLHTDPATPAPSRPSELASPSGQRARAGGRPRRRLLSRFADRAQFRRSTRLPLPAPTGALPRSDHAGEVARTIEFASRRRRAGFASATKRTGSRCRPRDGLRDDACDRPGR